MTEKQDDTTVTPSTITGQSGSPTNYRELWSGLESTPWEEFFKLFPLHGDGSDMWDLLLEVHPKQFPVGLLVLVEATPEDYYVVPIHSLEKARSSDPSSSNQMRKTVVGVEGDVQDSTSHVTYRKVQGLGPALFETLADLLVPTDKGVERRRGQSNQWSEV